MHTLIECRDALGADRISAVQLLDGCLENALVPDGEGERVFVELQQTRAMEQARVLDSLRGRNASPSPWSGIPISIKDLFDVAGQVTRAGSLLLGDAPPANATAPAIQRLEDAGFVVVGRTNMTEFAYSGVGLNPHYGTPKNPYNRGRGLIPGGSSSGAAVSVTDGMAVAGIGTDTGGSCRIPAALTGIVGFKPTARRISLEGVYPLSPSLDSVGSLATSVSCCAILDDVMAGGHGWLTESVEPSTIRLAVLDHYVTEGMDDEVAGGWDRALAALDGNKVRIESVRLPDVESIPELNTNGGLAAAEAFSYHRGQLAAHGEQYDPRVGNRIRAGSAVDEAELGRIREARRRMIAAFERLMGRFDAMLAPTVPIIAPPLDAFETDEEYVRLNLLLLRNPSLFNFLDGCAISIPMHLPGDPPAGLMLAAPAGCDRQLLSCAAALEGLLSSARR